MKEQPVILLERSVLAVLGGKKTQLRKVVDDCAAFKVHDAPGEDTKPDDAYDVINSTVGPASAAFLVAGDHGFTDWVDCPFGAVGDHLWVQETWSDQFDPSDLPRLRNSEGIPDGVSYQAGHRCSDFEMGCPCKPINGNWNAWQPPASMPRWASRLTLEITGVRVERLQDVSDEDAAAVGVDLGTSQIGSDNGVPARVAIYDVRKAFAVLWDVTNDKMTSWASNPWVWVLSFKRVEVPQ